MNTMQATNTPRPVMLAGREYMVSELTIAEWGKVQAWLVANVPSPMEALKSAGLDDFSPAQQRTMMLVALKEQQAWPPAPRTEAWFDALNRTGKDGRDGSTVFLHAVLAKHQPALTYEGVEPVARQATGEESARVMMLAFGREPTDPKA